MNERLNESGSTETTARISSYPAALCREQVSDLDGSLFRAISFRYNGIWASFTIPEAMISPAVSRNGREIPNRFTIDLGEADDVRFVSLRTDDYGFERKAMFNSTIKKSIEANRKEYLRSIAV